MTVKHEKSSYHQCVPINSDVIIIVASIAINGSDKESKQKMFPAKLFRPGVQSSTGKVKQGDFAVAFY